MSLKPLTGQQERVLEFVSEFLGRRGFPPTLREIGEAVGLANVNAVRGHVLALEKKGYITKDPEKARSIQIVHTPSALSRAKRVLHEVWGTDVGVLHQVTYGLAWTTWRRTAWLTGRAAALLREALEREAVEHGWTLADARIQADHVVITVQVWPNHSAQQTVHRLQSAGSAERRRRPEALPNHPLWGPGYAATTDLASLDRLVNELLSARGGADRKQEESS